LDYVIIEVASTKPIGDCAIYMEGQIKTFAVLMDVRIVVSSMGRKSSCVFIEVVLK
jgi:hypothetical protein